MELNFKKTLSHDEYNQEYIRYVAESDDYKYEVSESYYEPGIFHANAQGKKSYEFVSWTMSGKIDNAFNRCHEHYDELTEANKDA